MGRGGRVSRPIRLTRRPRPDDSGPVRRDLDPADELRASESPSAAASDHVLASQLRALEVRFRALVEGVAGRMRKQLHVIADGLLAKVDELQEGLAVVGQRLGELHAEMRRALMRVERRVHRLDERLADLERRHAATPRAGCRRGRPLARRH